MALETSVKTEIKKKFGISKNDSGSSQVQIALMTERIREITEHAEKNPKDASSQRGLLILVAKRRKFLDYLKKTNPEEYRRIVELLGLRK
jgi:small subunit ribosomal protein S15